MRHVLLLALASLPACGSSKPTPEPADPKPLFEPAPIDHRGERGLRELRAALHRSPAVGLVERGPSGMFLVHAATGARIAIPPGGECGDHGTGQRLFFEGEPGAALSLSDHDVSIQQHDAARDCVLHAVVANELELEAPSVIATLSGAPTSGSIEHGGKADAFTVALAPDAAELRRGGEVVWRGAVQNERVCGVSAEVTRGALPGVDGTVVRVSYTISTLAGQPASADCESGIEELPTELEAANAWDLVIDRGGRVHERVVLARESFHLGAKGRRRFTLPIANGALVCDSVLSRQSGREGFYDHSESTWTFVPAGGGEAIAFTGDGGASGQDVETGLRPLRAALAWSNEIIGVVADGWLTFGPEKIKLAPATGAPEVEPFHAREVRFFEGAPGAALVLNAEEAAVVRWDSATGALKWTRAFALDVPATKPLISFQRSARAPWKEGEKGVTKSITLEGHAGPIDVVVTRAALTVRRRDDDEVLYETGVGLDHRACSGEVRATVATGTRDGATWLVLESRSKFQWTLEDDCTKPGTRETGAGSARATVVFPADGSPAQVRYSLYEDEFPDALMEQRVAEARYPLPDGVLEYRGQQDAPGSTVPQTSLIWTFVPAAGDKVVIHEGM